MQKLDISLSGLLFAIIESVENGSTTGTMSVASEGPCTRGEIKSAKGTLELSGKKYVGDGGGCHGQFEVSGFTPSPSSATAAGPVAEGLQ